MRRYVTLYIFLLLVSSCKQDVPAGDSSEMIRFVPHGAEAILATENPSEIAQDLDENEVIKNFARLQGTQEIGQAGHFLGRFEDAQSLVCLNLIGRNKPVISLLTEEKISAILDSTGLKTSTSDYTIAPYRQYDNDSTKFYAARSRGITIASSSELMVEEFLRRTKENTDVQTDEELTDLYERTESFSGFNFYLRGHGKTWINQFLLGEQPTDQRRNGAWYQLEPKISEDAFTASGLITYSNSQPHIMRLFKGLEGKEPRSPEIIPADLTEAKIFTYNDFSAVRQNLKNFRQLREMVVNNQLSSLMESSVEIAEVALGDASFIIFRFDSDGDILQPQMEGAMLNYHDTEFLKLNKAVSTAILKPLLQPMRYEYLIQNGDYTILANSKKSAQIFISRLERNSTLDRAAWFMEALEDVDPDAPVMHVLGKSFLDGLTDIASAKDKSQLKKLKSTSAKGMLITMRDESGYAHVNLALPTEFEKQEASAVQQLLTIAHPVAVIGGPWFFKNHVNGRYDIAFQDEENVLYLYDINGKKLWSKTLPSRIIGNIHTVDTYKNNKYQMVFTTAKGIYNLDRLGRDVADFPIKLKSEATQGLALFDYDGNRRYRLVSTQGSEVKMYDAKGAAVNGFKYSPDGQVLRTPSHFRVSGKDYIAFPTTSGKRLKILNRVGKIRTPVDADVNISSRLAQYKNLLYFINGAGNLQSVNLQNGKVKEEKEPFDKGSPLEFIDKIPVGIRDGRVAIGKTKTDQIVGSPASIKSFEDQIFVLDQASNELYGINKDGETILGFPVYGDQKLAIKNHGKRLLLATIDEAGILIYAQK